MNKFKRLRVEVLKMTQKDLAKLWGCSERTIRRYEKNPRPPEIVYLEHYLIPKYYYELACGNETL